MATIKLLIELEVEVQDAVETAKNGWYITSEGVEFDSKPFFLANDDLQPGQFNVTKFQTTVK